MELSKKIIMFVLVCTTGSVTIHLMLPLILAALVSGLAFSIPVLFYEYIIRRKWRIRFVQEPEALDMGEPSAYGKDEGSGTKGIDNENGQEATEDENTYGLQNDSYEKALQWYRSQGQQRLERIVIQQNRKGFKACWIRSDGICNIRTRYGYRRAGIFPGFPSECRKQLADLLKKDGWNASMQGKYIHISWEDIGDGNDC